MTFSDEYKYGLNVPVDFHRKSAPGSMRDDPHFPVFPDNGEKCIYIGRGHATL